jgi:hypothetical protein
MNEHEVSTASDATFFVANEVVNEYHAFPVVQRADIGGANFMFILITQTWFKFEVRKVIDPEVVMRLEALAS